MLGLHRLFSSIYRCMTVYVVITVSLGLYNNAYSLTAAEYVHRQTRARAVEICGILLVLVPETTASHIPRLQFNKSI